MRTHEQIAAKLLRRPGVRVEVERIEREEGALLDLLLKARHDAGLTHAEVAQRMGTQPPHRKVHGFTVATRDTSPFIAAGVRVINLWDEG